MVVSTPARNVIWLTLQLVHAPSRRTFTCLSSSMEINVEAFRQDPLNGIEAHASTAYLTFVAIDQYGKPLPVPQIEPQTPIEKQRFEEAAYRRQERLRHREEMNEMRKKE